MHLFLPKNILVVVGQLPPVTQLIAKVRLFPTIEEISARLTWFGCKTHLIEVRLKRQK